MSRWIGFAASVAALISGCATVQLSPQRPRQSLDRVEHVNERDYAIGVERTAVVGDSVVRLKTYDVQHLTTHSTHYTVSEPCKVGVGFASATFAPGDEIPTAGEMPCDDGACAVLVIVQRSDGMRMGTRVDAQGRPVGVALNLLLGAKLVSGADVTPETCRFIPMESHTETIAKGATYRNFEILYGGIDGQTMRFTYREYSPDDLARPAFSQAFSYPLGSAQVKFKDVSLRIVEARPDALRYVVEADGN